MMARLDWAQLNLGLVFIAGWVGVALAALHLRRRIHEAHAAQAALARHHAAAALHDRPLSCGLCRELGPVPHEVTLSDGIVWVCGGCAELLDGAPRDAA